MQFSPISRQHIAITAPQRVNKTFVTDTNQTAVFKEFDISYVSLNLQQKEYSFLTG
jgi:hypothetical protein